MDYGVINETDGNSIPSSDSNYAIGNFTRDTSIASGTQAVVGLGFKPKIVYLDAGITASVERSWGFSDATSDYAWRDRHNVGADTWGINLVDCVQLATSGAIAYVGTVQSMDADGFTMDWTKFSSMTGTAHINYIAFK
jgi:hypothetical protein